MSASDLIVHCDHCEYKTKNKNDMTKHIEGFHQKITYPCGVNANINHYGKQI